MVELHNSASKRKRKPRLRFGLKYLILAMLFASLCLGWFANELRQAKFEADLVETIDALHDGYQPHGEYLFDYETGPEGAISGAKKDPTGPAWLRSIFGPHVFSRITNLSFHRTVFTRKPTRSIDIRQGNQHSISIDVIKGFQLEKLESLLSIGLLDFYEIEDLNWLPSLHKLKSLSVDRCSNLKSLDGIENLSQLKSIRVFERQSMLEDIVAIDGLNELELININVGKKFPTQGNWDALANCPKLNRLQINKANIAFRNFPRRAKEAKDDPDDITTLLSDRSFGKHLDQTPPLRGSFRPSPNMQFLSIADVDLGLQDLSCFGEMPNLEHLEIHSSAGLESLEGIQHCKNLSHLAITSCHNLKDISAIESLAKLETLSITKSQRKIECFPVLNCRELKRLDLSHTLGLKDLEFLRNTNNIEVLDVRDSGLRSLKGLRHLGKLKTFQVEGSALTSIGCDIVDPPFQNLSLKDCDSLVDLEGLENIKNLSSINLTGCFSLTSLKGMSQLTEMEHLDLTDCRSLKNMDDLKSMPQVKHVVVKGCISLEDIEGLLELPTLESFDWSDCPLLKTEDVEVLRKKFPTLVEAKDILD